MTDEQSQLAAIATLMKGSGHTVDELKAFLEEGGDTGSGGITIAQYVDQVSPTLPRATERTYRIHFHRLVHGEARQCECVCATCVEAWDTSGTCECQCGTCRRAISFEGMGDRVLRPKAVTRTELDPLPDIAQRIAAKRAARDNVKRAKRGLAPKPAHGQGAREGCVTALRCLFGRAVDDELIQQSPADKLDKGHRSEPKRRALSDEELAQLFEVVTTGGDDPELDFAITWTELELGARREGLVTLTVGRLHPETQMIDVFEKGRRERSQPCSAELIDFLLMIAIKRGGARCKIGQKDYDPNANVFYFRDSTPQAPHALTSRRFDTLHRRIQSKLPWANQMGYSGHALRHTVGTIVERYAGTQVARKMLGHGQRKPTDIYTDASMTEVARAVSAMTGLPHPMAADEEHTE